MSGLWYCSLCGQGQQVQVAPIGFEGEELCGGCHREAVWSSRVAERDERITVLETQLRYAAKAPESPADSGPAGHPWLKDDPIEPFRHPWLVAERERTARLRRVTISPEVGDRVRWKGEGRVTAIRTSPSSAANVRGQTEPPVYSLDSVSISPLERVPSTSAFSTSSEAEEREATTRATLDALRKHCAAIAEEIEKHMRAVFGRGAS